MTLEQDIEIYKNKKRELTAEMIDEVADRVIIHRLKFFKPSNKDDAYFAIKGMITEMLDQLFYIDEAPYLALDYVPEENKNEN